MLHTEPDEDAGASRRILAAVLALAVEDLKLDKDDPNRIASESFFWGANKAVSEKYLMLLGMDPERFCNALKAKVVDKV